MKRSHSVFLFSLFFSLLFVFPSVGFPIEKSFTQEIIQQKKLDHWKEIQKVEKSDLVMGTLMTLAEEAWQNNRSSDAIAYAEEATRFAPESPLPHFFLAHILKLSNQNEAIQFLGEYGTAIKLSLSHFWLITSSIGIFALTAFIAIFFSTVVFLYYVFILYFPQWIHFIQERLLIHSYSIGLVLILLFLLLFFLVPPFWFLLVSLFLFSFFYRPWEKRVALFLSAGLALFTLLFAPSLILLTAKQSQVMNKMVSNQQGEYLWTQPEFSSAITDDLDWRILFIKASYLTQKRDFAGAEALYQQALIQHPDSAMIFNNMGNTFFYRNNLNQALEYYQKAVLSDPNYITAHYNISQLYNEQLLFDEGEKKYLEIKAIDQERTQYFSKIVTDYPNYPVIDGRFTEEDLWRELLGLVVRFESEKAGEIWRLWIGDLQLMQFVMLILFTGLGFMGLSLYWTGSISGTLCSICFRAICSRCQVAFSDNSICGECGKNLKIAIGKKKGTIAKRVYPFFILPGGGQLVRQKPLLAFLLLLSFFFIVTLIAMGDQFLSSAQWRISIENAPILYLALFALYTISLYDMITNLIIKRKHS